MSGVSLIPVKKPVTNTLQRRGGRTRISERNKRVFQLLGTECHYCGLPDATTVDHIVPKSKGGGERIKNLVPCCRQCNASKGTKSYEDFLEYRFLVAVTYSKFAEMEDCL